ncbi:MAG: kinase [Pseudomonadota bacterium]
MTSSLQAALEKFAAKEQLPVSYLQTVEQWFLPLAEQVLRKASTNHQALLVGVSGCQGSGKSTLASLLVLLLKELMGLNAINLSIDDFYLTHADRQTLARTVHPLLATRGVPGTHDVELALNTIANLRKQGRVAIPRFNKAIDDRAPQDEWPVVMAPVDVIVLEGWCLAVPAQAEDALVQPINELEAKEDPQGLWRRHVNQKINADYSRLYDMIDYLIMLKAPDFAKVFEWRQNQEDKLAARLGSAAGNRIMNKEQLHRFIQHYERITRHGLNALPAQADVVFELTDEQTIAGML